MDKKLSTISFFISSLKHLNIDNDSFKLTIFNLTPTSSCDLKSFNEIKYAILKDFDDKNVDISIEEFIQSQIDLLETKSKIINDIKTVSESIESVVSTISTTIPILRNNFTSIIDDFKTNISKELNK